MRGLSFKKIFLTAIMIILLIFCIGSISIHVLNGDVKVNFNEKADFSNEINTDKSYLSIENSDENFSVLADKEEVESTQISFYQGQSQVNERFNANNWFPGDYEIKGYQIKVNHDKDVDLYFDIDIDEETKSLSEILNIKIVLVETSEIVFDGTIKEIEKNQKIYKLLANSNNESIVNMQIEVSLPTSSGNEYQDAMLNADFIWYILDDDALTPPTGVKSNVVIWVLLMIISLLLIILLLKKKDKSDNNKTLKKMRLTFVSVFIIICGVFVTTFALVHEKLVLDNNIFSTGTIKLNLNDGKSVIDNDLYIEPGMTLLREFFLENNGTGDAYYKLYFKNIDGSLSNVLDIEIRKEDQILYSGKLKDLTIDLVNSTDDILESGERVDFDLIIHFPEDATNVYQETKLTFELAASATQVKNNDNKEY